MADITIPYNFTPRDYQMDVFKARDRGVKRFVEVWHRRAGKDKVGINFMAREMIRRPGIYYYLLPTYAQGRKIIWEGIDGQGFRFLDHIPKELRKRTLHQEMMIELKEEFGGSIFRVVGVDKIDRVVGTNPVGIVYSEYSLMDPSAWRFFEPILMENGGWAYFDFTPRGRNHAYLLAEMARKSKDWHFSLNTVEDTGVVSAAQIEEIRAQGTPEEIIQQEYYCSFAAGMSGSIYAAYVEKAREQKRIGLFPADESVPCDTFWDLGFSEKDLMTCIVRQTIGGMRRLVRAKSWRQSTFTDCARWLKETGLYFNDHVLPHDGARGNAQTGMTNVDRFQMELQKHNVTGAATVQPRSGPDQGIAVVRAHFPKYQFDQEGCGDLEREGADENDNQGLIPALMNYHMRWNPERGVFDKPVHDWSSHWCDGVRTMAMYDDDIGDSVYDSGMTAGTGGNVPKVLSDFDPFGGY